MYSIVIHAGRSFKEELAYEVYADEVLIARSPRLEQAVDAFESDVQLYVAEMAPRRVFVHAGVVGWKGHAVLFPGRSFSGKTTLTAEFVRQGFTYYSDEYAVLDQAGRVHPYPRLLGIRKRGALERADKVPVETLGGRAGIKPLAVTLVVVTQYKAEAVWRPRPISAGQGVLLMFQNTVSARSNPDAALAALRSVAVRSRFFRGQRGEASSVAAFVREFLG
jgi:hypothetical protein